MLNLASTVATLLTEIDRLAISEPAFEPYYEFRASCSNGSIAELNEAAARALACAALPGPSVTRPDLFACASAAFDAAEKMIRTTASDNQMSVLARMSDALRAVRELRKGATVDYQLFEDLIVVLDREREAQEHLVRFLNASGMAASVQSEVLDALLELVWFPDDASISGAEEALARCIRRSNAEEMLPTNGPKVDGLYPRLLRQLQEGGVPAQTRSRLLVDDVEEGAEARLERLKHQMRKLREAPYGADLARSILVPPNGEKSHR